MQATAGPSTQNINQLSAPFLEILRNLTMDCVTNLLLEGRRKTACDWDTRMSCIYIRACWKN